MSFQQPKNTTFHLFLLNQISALFRRLSGSSFQCLFKEVFAGWDVTCETPVPLLSFFICDNQAQCSECLPGETGLCRPLLSDRLHFCSNQQSKHIKNTTSFHIAKPTCTGSQICGFPKMLNTCLNQRDERNVFGHSPVIAWAVIAKHSRPILAQAHN